MIFWTQVKIAMAAVVLLCLLGAGGIGISTLVAQEAQGPRPVPSEAPPVKEAARPAEPSFPRHLPAPRSDVPQDLLISPKQNLELMRKAWKTPIACAYRNKKPNEILEDLARQSGLKIRMLPSAQPLRGGGPSTPADYRLDILSNQERADYFLGSDAAVLEMKGKWLTLQDAFTRLETTQPTSLAPVLDAMARLLGRNVSYRDDEIVLGSPEDLLPELLVTCRIKLAKGGWGQMYHVNVNGTPRTIRLSLEDAVAYHMLLLSDMQIQHAGMNFGDPRGAAVAMRKFKPGLDIQYDPATKTLELSGTPQMARIWHARVLREVDQAAPDGPAFQAARLKQWAQETAGHADAATRADLEKRAGLLEADDYPVRLKAVDDLIALGKDAAYAVLPLEAKTTSREARLRAQIVLHKIYGDEEIRQVRARAEGYLKAAMSGDLAALREKYWDQARKERFEKEVKESQRLALFLKKPQDYEGEFKKNIMIQDVKIEQIALSGSTACITFSTTSKKDLFQVDRVVSGFYMVFDGKAWMAGPGGTELPIEQPILWTAKDGLPTEELDPSAAHIVTGKYSGGSKDSHSARSYGIDFGF